MTNEQKTLIAEMRKNGLGYIKIAQQLGISENTVKSFCRRNKLSANTVPTLDMSEDMKPCKCCGKPVKQNPGRKAKLFCSDKCRNTWWNAHLNEVKRKAMYEYTCPTCGKPFTAYGNANRKYCCHVCYVEDRFGGAK